MATPNTTSSLPELVLFTYPESVFGRRLTRYLNLRSLPYTPIRVPPNMPRPLLDRLSIKHRRIPILAVGRDIYIDTRLIIRKLEVLFPDSSVHLALGAKSGFEKGLEEMLESWVIDAGPFWRTAGCLPVQAPLLKDDVWMKDRFDGSGGAFTLEGLKENRAWCISQLRIFFGFMENLLSDGRNWVLGGDGPGLTDVHGAWVFDWAVNMAADIFVAAGEKEAAMGDMDRVLSEEEFPKVHGWVKSFRDECERAEKQNVGVRQCGEGQEAEDNVVRNILGSGYAEPQELPFGTDDILGLNKGQYVSIAPADFGFAHADIGTLVGLSRNEVVIEVAVQAGKEENLRLHFPRIGFKIVPADKGNSN